MAGTYPFSVSNLTLVTRPSYPTLGEIIRRQRELSELSMRQFAAMVGISNPYLSQIERGLREPSEQVLDAIARSLRISADSLYEQAGFVESDEDEALPVVEAIRNDTSLTGRQRQALIEVYEAFAAKNGVRPPRRRRRSRGAGDASNGSAAEVSDPEADAPGTGPEAPAPGGATSGAEEGTEEG
jgi:transcriptional regulator with XRE-family HTH domain